MKLTEIFFIYLACLSSISYGFVPGRYLVNYLESSKILFRNTLGRVSESLAHDDIIDVA